MPVESDSECTCRTDSECADIKRVRENVLAVESIGEEIKGGYADLFRVV